MMLSTASGSSRNLLQFGSGCTINSFSGTEAFQEFGSGARSDARGHVECNPIS